MLFHCRDVFNGDRSCPPATPSERREGVLVWLLLIIVGSAAIIGSKRPDHYDEGTVVMPAINETQPECEANGLEGRT